MLVKYEQKKHKSLKSQSLNKVTPNVFLKTRNMLCLTGESKGTRLIGVVG